MIRAVRGVAVPCRHCQRPIVRVFGHGWVHTDSRVRCLDVWRWAELSSIAEPGGAS